MPASFTLTLDTTGPQGVTGALNGGAAYATSATGVHLTSSSTSTDVAQMKVWGDVAGGPLTEAAASWVTYEADHIIALLAGDGSKSIHFKLRDDVLNESATVDLAITLDTTAPTYTVTGPDVNKVSEQATKDTASFSFTPDSHIQAWKVKVVPSTSSLENAGTTIPTTAGSTNMTGGATASGTPVNCTIKGTDLKTASAGDGDKIVKVFVQDDAGNWSV